MSKRIYGGLSIQNAQELGFFDSDSSNYLALKAPSSLSGNTTLTLPNGDSTGTQALVSNGSGALSWASFLGTSLTSGYIYLGNGSNVATATEVTGDVTISNTGVTAIASGVIVDADINSSAAITLSKLAALTASRALTSDGSGVISVSAVTATELGYLSGVTSSVQTQINNLSSLIQNFEWQESVLSIELDSANIVGPSAGDRYLIAGTGVNAFATHNNKIAEYNGSGWDFTSPATGMYVSVDDETDGLYLYGGASWSKKQFEATTASTGLTKVGVDVRLDSSAAGAGLGFSAGVLSVNVDDSTVEINSDTVRLKDGGITNAKINASAAINFSKMEALTASRALVSDGSGVVSVSSVTSTELGYVSGVTSSIQTQLGNKAGTALDNLTVAGLANQDLLVASSGSAVSRLAVGSEGYILKVVSGNVAWAAPAAASTFADDWETADGATFAVTHSLGSKDVMVQVYDKSDDSTIELDSVVRTNTNTVTLTASQAPGASGWRVLVFKI